MDAARRSRNRFGVRGLVRAFGRRLVAVECGKASNFPGPLNATLLWRQVAKAAKAVTSHRTPNPCRPCAKFHHCSTDGHGLNALRRPTPKGSFENSPPFQGWVCRMGASSPEGTAEAFPQKRE